MPWKLPTDGFMNACMYVCPKNFFFKKRNNIAISSLYGQIQTIQTECTVYMTHIKLLMASYSEYWRSKHDDGEGTVPTFAIPLMTPALVRSASLQFFSSESLSSTHFHQAWLIIATTSPSTSTNRWLAWLCRPHHIDFVCAASDQSISGRICDATHHPGSCHLQAS